MKFKKTLVIGYKKGLGNSLFKKIKLHSISVEGTDLDEWIESSTNSEIYYDKFISKKNFDLILLNAHLGFEGTNLIKIICEKNKIRKFTLLIIGSIVTDQSRREFYPYYLEKLNLEVAVRQFQLQYKEINLTLFKPGWINTDFIKHIKGEKMKVSVAADFIIDSLMLSKKYNVQLIKSSFIKGV